MKQHAAHLGEHLRHRLFFYASGAIAIGWVLGANFPQAASAHARELGWVMNALVFLMIYPMMIGLNLAQIPKALKQPRPLLLTLFYNFVVTPLLSIALVWAMAAPPELALGFYLVMLIPGASMAIALSAWPVAASKWPRWRKQWAFWWCHLPCRFSCTGPDSRSRSPCHWAA
ncbi:MAG: hypothetical protein CO065_13525 [Comamonadaceae bacterium CG_4_9_14_0_8_um_filter_57_21]|nr:MAG: hypothetical protein CO065_13525 [Comamonadaceae bacterium CG_4_9_14_0_8_um_filter_57_21]